MSQQSSSCILPSFQDHCFSSCVCFLDPTSLPSVNMLQFAGPRLASRCLVLKAGFAVVCQEVLLLSLCRLCFDCFLQASTACFIAGIPVRGFACVRFARRLCDSCAASLSALQQACLEPMSCYACEACNRTPLPCTGKEPKAKSIEQDFTDSSVAFESKSL